MGGMVRLHNQEAAAARTSETVKSNQQRPTGEHYCTTSDSYPGVGNYAEAPVQRILTGIHTLANLNRMANNVD